MVRIACTYLHFRLQLLRLLVLLGGSSFLCRFLRVSDRLLKSVHLSAQGRRLLERLYLGRDELGDVALHRGHVAVEVAGRRRSGEHRRRTDQIRSGRLRRAAEVEPSRRLLLHSRRLPSKVEISRLGRARCVVHRPGGGRWLRCDRRGGVPLVQTAIRLEELLLSVCLT